MRRLLCTVLALSWSSVAVADVVHLTDGGRLEGAVRTVADEVAVTTAIGEVRVARSEVARIERAASPVQVYLERAAALRPGDTTGHRRLAQWARAQGLDTYARQAWREVLAGKPNDGEARRALGYVRHEGRWLTEAENQRRLGRVRFAGAWVTSEEADARRANLRELADARERDRDRRANVAAAKARAQPPAPAASQNDGGSIWQNPPLFYPRRGRRGATGLRRSVAGRRGPRAPGRVTATPRGPAPKPAKLPPRRAPAPATGPKMRGVY